MSKKKVIIIISVILLALITSFIIFKVFYKTNINVELTLLGDSTITILYGEEYKELGYKLIVNNEDNTSSVKVTNNIDYNKIGNYTINYLYIDKYKEKHEIDRTIIIIDNIPPIIKLEGNSEINILEGEEYNEPGYTVEDNYDKDLHDLVEATTDLDTSKSGTYEIKYKVCDSSNNCSETSRKVSVAKPKTVVVKTETKNIEKETDVSSIINGVSNTITKNKFESNGIYYEGYCSNKSDTYTIKLKNTNNEYTFNMTKLSDNTYKGNIDISNVLNGKYEVYINDLSLLNKMEKIERIVRSKINNKLVTLEYSNDIVYMTIDDFSYQYDIYIDVGHGGYDTGAVNKYIEEKEMNLTISNYEKCRYNELGYSVFINRTDDTYGLLMGDTTWRNLSRRAYAMGYYGVVSKIVYSNHNNSNSNSDIRGYEIITPAQYDNINTELQIASRFNNIYPNLDSHLKVYSRDYDTEAMYSSLNNKQYTYRNYYAIIKIPYELFNVKTIIYEGCYMSNDSDFDWFWKNSNWKEVSEIKIEEYVKSLGGTYTKTTSCK